MSAKILIVSGFEITANPRVVKEADALAEAGHQVTVLGAIHSAESKVRIDDMLRGRDWSHIAVFDQTDVRNMHRVAQNLARVRSRFSRKMNRQFGWESHRQISPVVDNLTRVALKGSADLTILHLEPALWAGIKLLEAGRRVAIDFEDWYSEDLLPADRAGRPLKLLRACEKRILQQAAYATTTSESLASALANANMCHLPTVVYNSFPIEGRKTIDRKQRDRADFRLPSVTWFSQTIGPGRGLEELVAAMGLVKTPFQLHIRGTPRPGIEKKLRAIENRPEGSRIYFHRQVPQKELISRLAEHDVGYCGELSNCASRDLTITNKMFEYMRAGLAIIATDTKGQSEVKSKAGDAVRIFSQNDTNALALELEELISNPSRLAKAKMASARALEEHFDWGNSKQRMQELVAIAVENKVSRM